MGRKEDRPVIAVAWRGNQESESFVCTIRAIEAAGGAPVTLPMVKADFLTYENGKLEEGIDEHGALSLEAAQLVRRHGWRDSDAEKIMQGYYAIVFPGGEDISPSLYANPQAVEINEGFSPERDVSDYLLLSYCLEHDPPILCICRGMQALSVVSGAEMIQDIGLYMDSLGKAYAYEHRSEPEIPEARRDFTFHDVRVMEGSNLKRIVRTDVIPNAASWHHQAVRSVEGTKLAITGICETNGLPMIEAVERTDKSFVIGLQFHPEISVVRGLDDLSLSYFRALVQAAEKNGSDTASKA